MAYWYAMGLVWILLKNKGKRTLGRTWQLLRAKTIDRSRW